MENLDERPAKKPQTRWTDEMTAQAAKLYHDHTADEVAKKVNELFGTSLTAGAVAQKLWALGQRKTKPHKS